MSLKSRLMFIELWVCRSWWLGVLVSAQSGASPAPNAVSLAPIPDLAGKLEGQCPDRHIFVKIDGEWVEAVDALKIVRVKSRAGEPSAFCPLPFALCPLHFSYGRPRPHRTLPFESPRAPRMSRPGTSGAVPRLSRSCCCWPLTNVTRRTRTPLIPCFSGEPTANMLSAPCARASEKTPSAVS